MFTENQPAWRARQRAALIRTGVGIIVCVISLLLNVSSIRASDLDDYRLWGQGTANGFNDGTAYRGWCLANAYTKVLIQSGAYEDTFTPDEFDKTLSNHLGYDAVSDWSGYCNFTESAVQAISNSRITGTFRIGVGWADDADSLIMEQVEAGNQVIIRLGGHYIAVDVPTSKLKKSTWVMDSLNTQLNSEAGTDFRREHANVPLEEAQAILRGSGIYELIVFESLEEPQPETTKDILEKELQYLGLF